MEPFQDEELVNQDEEIGKYEKEGILIGEDSPRQEDSPGREIVLEGKTVRERKRVRA